MSDTVFRNMAASNVSMAWGKVNEQLYNDILRPSPTAAASIATPMAIVLWPPQPFGPATTFSNTYGSPSTAPNLPSSPGHSQQAAICRDFNRRTCCCSNCQFKHICNKPDCGSRKLPRLPVPESTSAVIVHGKCLKVSWIGAVSSWGVGSLSYCSISWRTCLNLAAWYSLGAISFLRFWISCRDSIWKVWWSWLTALRPLFKGIQL